MSNHRAVITARVWLLAGIGLLSCAPVWSQQWPIKPAHHRAVSARGQGANIVGRLVAERLTAALGQQVIVENRPGAGSMLGTEYAAKAPGDGTDTTARILAQKLTDKWSQSVVVDNRPGAAK